MFVCCGSDPDDEDPTDSDPNIEDPTGSVRPDDPDPWEEPVYDPNELPTGVPSLNIAISDDKRAALELAPYRAADVKGSFTDENGVVYDNVDIKRRECAPHIFHDARQPMVTCITMGAHSN